MLKYSKIHKSKTIEGLFEVKYTEERIILERGSEAIEIVVIDESIVQYRKHIVGRPTSDFEAVSIFFQVDDHGQTIPSVIIDDEILTIPII